MAYLMLCRFCSGIGFVHCVVAKVFLPITSLIFTGVLAKEKAYNKLKKLLLLCYWCCAIVRVHPSGTKTSRALLKKSINSRGKMPQYLKVQCLFQRNRFEIFARTRAPPFFPFSPTEKSQLESIFNVFGESRIIFPDWSFSFGRRKEKRRYCQKQ